MKTQLIFLNPMKYWSKIHGITWTILKTKYFDVAPILISFEIDKFLCSEIFSTYQTLLLCSMCTGIHFFDTTFIIILKKDNNSLTTIKNIKITKDKFWVG